MLNLYSLYPDKQGYRFKNVVGDEYYAYFTPFTLQTEDITPYETMSFGFECKRVNPDKRQIYDERTKQTIAYIIKDYFDKNGDDALLYICLTNDGKARQRNIIFSKWFKELGNEYERPRSKIETQYLDFFSSIIVKSNNSGKDKIINAFHYTIDFWFPYKED